MKINILLIPTRKSSTSRSTKDHIAVNSDHPPTTSPRRQSNKEVIPRNMLKSGETLSASRKIITVKWREDPFPNSNRGELTIQQIICIIMTIVSSKNLKFSLTSISQHKLQKFRKLRRFHQGLVKSCTRRKF